MKSYIVFIITVGFFLLFIPTIVAGAIQEQNNDPEYWYNKGVDLANEGKYAEALAATDQALAINMSFPRAHAMRSGLLVMLGNYEEAITEADFALSSKDNLSTTFAVAWANKGDALRHLGRIDEARAAFTKAKELDASLVLPEVTPTKSPLPAAVVIAAIAVGGLLWCRSLKRPDRPD
jgi:tetratricopeptide (TPR) repeat protein